MKRSLIALAACAALALSGCAPATPAAPPVITVNGVLTIHGNDSNLSSNQDDTGCLAFGDYADTGDGASVSVTDPSGKIIGLGTLKSVGKAARTPIPPASVDVMGTSGLDVCTFKFTVRDVPAGEKFYGVQVAHRGVIEQTAQQVASGISLTLG